ncbi:MAG: hypothetical protein LBP35_04125 [Candidatus Ancillula trichonymphae]|jgi:hypothetical protein|nr:hypothetical protein [Candidatus Ancillula trichonymphae]
MPNDVAPSITWNSVDSKPEATATLLRVPPQVRFKQQWDLFARKLLITYVFVPKFSVKFEAQDAFEPSKALGEAING